MKFVSAVASVAAVLLAGTALASDATAPSAEQVLNSLAVYHQTDTARFKIGPRWSQQYGWAIDARGGMMLSEALAVGLVVTYGENDRELVVNAGLQLDDDTIIIGTLAGHQQNVPVGDDRELVDQLEGGVSLRSDDGVGFIGGYEINVYGTRSSTAGSLATGTVLGADYNILFHPIEGMTARLGAGYERIDWANGDPTEGWTANLNVTQKVGATVIVKVGIDLGQSEDRYTAGTEFLLADGGDTNSRLGLEYSYIVDKDGGDDEQRLTAYWRVGFGEGSEPAASSAIGYVGDVALVEDGEHSHDRILGAVIEKQDYLPANVLAKSENSVSCPLTIITYTGYGSVPVAENKYTLNQYVFFAVDDNSIDATRNWSFTINGESASFGLTDWGDYAGTDEFYSSISAPLSGTVTFTASAPGYSCNITLTQGPVV
jgi:hypothetical protein